MNTFLLAVSAMIAAVPSPWTTPVEKEGTVSVWGREYAYASNALPVSIKTQGRELLAGPIRVIAADKDGKEIVWTKAGSLVLTGDEESKTICGWQASNVATIDAVSRIEFDGMIEISLAAIAGPASGKAELSRLWLEIPLKRSAVTLFNYYPSGWSHISYNGAVKATALAWPFRASVWLGTERAGLCWFCESAEQFLPVDNKNAVEILPDGESVVLRVRLAEGKFDLPRTYNFGLQATPVKPMPKNFAYAHTMHSPRMGISVCGVKRPEVWWTAQRAFPEGKVEESLDLAAKLGVKTICFHEDWIPVQNNPTALADFKAIVDGCHRRGIKAMVYEGYELSSLDPFWGRKNHEWLLRDLRDKPSSGWYREPAQRDFVVCYQSDFARTWLDRVKRTYAALNLDGVYLDGTICPRGCANARHGCGWTDEKGQRHYTFPILAVRRMMRELYEFVDARGGRIDAHQSGYTCPATLAFAHSYWDGEQLACSRLDIKGALVNLDAFRAEFIGMNYGVPSEFLCYEKPGWSYDNALAISLLHNVSVRPCFFDSIAKIAPVWQTFDDFGVADATFLPYWETPVKVSPECVKVSGWRKANGETLYVVSNLSTDKSVEATIELPRGRRTLSLAPFAYKLIKE